MNQLKAVSDRLTKLHAVYERPGSPAEKAAAARAIVRLQEKLHGIYRYQVWEVKPYTLKNFDKV